MLKLSNADFFFSAMHAQQVSPHAAQHRLEELTSAKERETEELAEGFIRGSVSVNDFVEKFTAQRRDTYIRRVHTDKFKEFTCRLPAPSLTQQTLAAHNLREERLRTHGAGERRPYQQS